MAAYHIEAICRYEVDNVHEAVQCGVCGQVGVAGVVGDGGDGCQVWEPCPVWKGDGGRICVVLRSSVIFWKAMSASFLGFVRQNGSRSVSEEVLKPVLQADSQKACGCDKT